MSGTWPTSPGPKDIKLANDQPVVLSESGTRKSQRRIVAGHLWRIKVTYPPMIRDEMAPIYAFAIKQRGESFQITVPDKNVPRGVGTGSPTVTFGYAPGELFFVTGGWTAFITGIMKAGDIIKFAGHSKVYMVAEDADSDALGNAAIYITSPLIESITATEVITVNNVPFTVALEGDMQDWKTTAPQLSAYSSDLVEVV